MRMFFTLENAEAITPAILDDIKEHFRKRPIVLIIQDAGESDLDEMIKEIRESIIRNPMSNQPKVAGTLEDLRKKFNLKNPGGEDD